MSMETHARPTERIIDCPIDVLTWTGAVDTILTWARRREPRYVCVCNVHAVVTARTDEGLRHAIQHADMATPDGMPLAWILTRRRGARQARVSGLDLTLRLCEVAACDGLPVMFYGATEATLAKVCAALATRCPGLRMVGTIAPPFRPLTPAEDDAVVEAIQRAQPGLLFVGLGCPKQEIWMAAHRDRIDAVMIGVGAAFDYLAGTVPRPPAWMQDRGLEWLGRLAREPRRLWRRYVVTNSVFLWCCWRELLRAPRRPAAD